MEFGVSFHHKFENIVQIYMHMLYIFCFSICFISRFQESDRFMQHKYVLRVYSIHLSSSVVHTIFSSSGNLKLRCKTELYKFPTCFCAFKTDPFGALNAYWKTNTKNLGICYTICIWCIKYTTFFVLISKLIHDPDMI